MLHKDTHSQAKSYHSELINILSCYVEGFNFRFKHEKTIKVFYYIICEYRKLQNICFTFLRLTTFSFVMVSH